MAKLDFDGSVRFISNKSLDISKKYKWLWVFAIVVSLYSPFSASGGLNLNVSNPSKYFNKQTELDTNDNRYNKNKNLLEDSSKVLGASTNYLEEIFSELDTLAIVVIILGFFLTAIISSVIVMYIGSWSYAGLAYGIKNTLNGVNPTLSQMSEDGKKYAIELTKLRIIPTIIALGGVTLAVLIAVFGNVVENPMVWALVFLVAAIAILVAGFYGTLTFTASQLVLFKNMLWKEAFSKSLSYIFDNLVLYIKIWVVNGVGSIVAGLLSFATYIPLMVVGGISIFSVYMTISSNNEFNPILFSILVIVVILILLATVFVGSILNGILQTFVTANWVQVFTYQTPVETPKEVQNGTIL